VAVERSGDETPECATLQLDCDGRGSGHSQTTFAGPFNGIEILPESATRVVGC